MAMEAPKRRLSTTSSKVTTTSTRGSMTSRMKEAMFGAHSETVGMCGAHAAELLFVTIEVKASVRQKT
jgi:hypothetical protein